MKRKIVMAVSVLSISIFSGCGGNSNNKTRMQTFEGKVDLAPIYKMLVCKSNINTSEINLTYTVQDLPKGCTYTDANGNYSLQLSEGSKIKILPVKGATKVIATKNDKLNPDTASNFNDTSFFATTTNTKSIIVMSDEVKNEINNLNSNQLYSLFRVTDKEDITKDFFDTNDTETAKIGAYKEARDAQDLVIKKLFSSYIIAADKNTTDPETLERKLDGYIFEAWKDVSKETNVTIYDKTVLKNVALGVIAKFNYDNPNNAIIGQSQDELENYTAILASAVSEPLVNINDNNVSMIAKKSQYLYAKTNDDLLNYANAFGKRIDNNITAAKQYENLSQNLANVLVSGYLTDAQGE